jgi:hypothetical protein
MISHGEDLFFSFHCIRLNDFSIGAILSTGDNAFPLQVRWKPCSEISNEELLTNNITTCDKNFNKTISTLNIILSYEKVGFVPSLKNPFINKFTSLLQLIHNTQISFLTLPLTIFNLNDDIGWITKSIEQSYTFNFNPLTSVLYSESIQPKFPKVFISIGIQDSYKTFNRTYSKIQDFLAAVGGFMKLIVTLLNLCNFFLRIYLIDNFIIGKVFDTENTNPVSYSQGNSIMEITQNVKSKK